MHDPQTLAFEIRSPIRKRSHQRPDGTWWHYRVPLITIWHVDPEADGSDDSCGWTWPKATQADRELCDELVKTEFDFWTGKYHDVASGGLRFSAHDMVWWAWVTISWKRGKRVALTGNEEREIRRLVANPHDNIRRQVRESGTREGLLSLLLCVDRLYRAHHRPWWKHPKWHVHHWKIQVHPWQTLRRWLFTRCAHCGKRFTYGGSPISHSWDKPKTRWFRSEVGLYHEQCSSIVSASAEKARCEERGEKVH